MSHLGRHPGGGTGATNLTLNDSLDKKGHVMPDEAKNKGIDLASRLDEAKRAAAKLSKSTDDLNAKFGMVEAELCSLNLGVSASVVLFSHNTFGFVTAVGPQPTTDLAFRKHGQEWGLFIESDKTVTRLTSASRDLRVIAAHKLGDLVSQLLDKVTAETIQVQDSVATVDQVLVELTRTSS
jgi:hypothetical protein